MEEEVLGAESDWKGSKYLAALGWEKWDGSEPELPGRL
jgi:hypothetical protein